MRIKKFLVAGGNSTALVFGCPLEERIETSKVLLGEVEQVGFASEDRLEMMGGELCINAILAFASTLSKGGGLFASGISDSVKYYNSGGMTKIEIPLEYQISDNVVLFKGIGFICVDKKLDKRIDKDFLSCLADKYKLPAFGAIVYDEDKIVPYVYVNGVDSFVRETACGSGSVAYALFSRFSKIVQPTGELLDINIKKDKVVVCGKVEEMLK